MADRNIRALYPSCKPVMIYALADPRDGSLKYVGKTETPSLRLKRHIWETTKRDDPKGRWIKDLLALGLSPSMVILETIEPGGDWAAAEKHHIASRICELLNQCSGGQGVPSDGRGEKWRRAIAASHLNNLNRKNGHKAQAEKMRGRRYTDEHKTKIAAGNKGKKLGAAHIEKLRAVNKNRVYSPETLMRMSAGQKGRKHSAESNEKRRQTMLLKRDSQSERQRNNWLDLEYRERIKARMAAVRNK